VERLSRPSDYPAAHTADTQWYAVHEEGQIATFVSDWEAPHAISTDLPSAGGRDDNAYPRDFPWLTARESASVYLFECGHDTAGLFVRSRVPDGSVLLDPAEILGKYDAKFFIALSLRFIEEPFLAPHQFMRCELFGERFGPFPLGDLRRIAFVDLTERLCPLPINLGDSFPYHQRLDELAYWAAQYHMSLTRRGWLEKTGLVRQAAQRLYARLEAAIAAEDEPEFMVLNRSLGLIADLEPDSPLPDFPAAHSGDTTWFAVDQDGNVGRFEGTEYGTLPVIDTSQLGLIRDAILGSDPRGRQEQQRVFPEWLNENEVIWTQYALETRHIDAAIKQLSHRSSVGWEVDACAHPLSGDWLGEFVVDWSRDPPLDLCERYRVGPVRGLLLLLEDDRLVAPEISAGRARVPLQRRRSERLIVEACGILPGVIRQLLLAGNCLGIQPLPLRGFPLEGDHETVASGLYSFRELSLPLPFFRYLYPNEPLRLDQLPALAAKLASRTRFPCRFDDLLFVHPQRYVRCNDPDQGPLVESDGTLAPKFHSNQEAASGLRYHQDEAEMSILEIAEKAAHTPVDHAGPQPQNG
jgi:hypothetical protein